MPTLPPELWAKVITSAVVPVVIISACGLLCLAFYNRLSSMVSRLRGFHRERMEEQQDYARAIFSGQIDRLMMARHHRVLEMLEEQTIRVTQRARMIRGTLLCLLGTIASLTACSVFTGLSVIWLPAMHLAAMFFFLGAPLLMAGVLLAMLEMKGALEPVQLEREFVSRLSKEFEELTRKEGNGVS